MASEMLASGKHACSLTSTPFEVDLKHQGAGLLTCSCQLLFQMNSDL